MFHLKATGTYIDIVTKIVCHDAADDIEAHVGACMTHVRVIIDGWTALVPSYFFGIDWHELVLK